MKKLGVYFLVAMLMVSFAIGSVSNNVYAETTKRIGIGNLTEDNLVAAWYFDEDSGDVVKDYKGSYDGTATGTTIVDTPYEKGRSFDGTDDYIQFDNPVIPLGEKSIRFKIKTTMQNEGMIFTNTLHGPTNKGMQFMLDEGHIYFAINIGYQNDDWEKRIRLKSNKSINDGQWHDILLTWNNTREENSLKIYVDNMSQPDNVATPIFTDPDIYSQNLNIGHENNLDPRIKAFQGQLDEIEIYEEVYIPLNAPTNLKAKAGDEEVKLSWDPVKGADRYIIKRSTTKGESYEEIGKTEDAIYTDKDKDIKNGTTYYYVVIAVIDGEESPKSNEASATPEGDSSSGSGDNALLRITMSNGKINEYDLSMSDVEDFIDWYEDRANDRGKPYYIMEKDYNIGPFESRKDYITFDKILQFEVMEYNK